MNTSLLIKQGLPFSIPFFVLSFFFLGFGFPLLDLISFFLLLFGVTCFFFFRSPQVFLISNDHHILSPASGCVVEVSEVWESTFRKRVQVVKVFLSVFDVHLQRYPISGVVSYVNYSLGKFLDARSPLASSQNENNSIVIKDQNLSVLVRQISGFIARRIDTYSFIGDMVSQGQELGVIYFGSRVEIFFEQHVNIQVQTGDRLKAGVSIVALV